MDYQQVNSIRWTKEQDEYVKQNYIFRSDDSITKIASALGRTRKSIKHRILKLGITGVTSPKYEGSVMKSKKPSVELAYLLGVYLSDGWIHKDGFYLRSIDRDYCERTIECLFAVLDGDFNSTITVMPKERLNANRSVKYSGDEYRVRIRSSDLCMWLTSVTKSKQEIPEAFINADAEIVKSLLSGLMDGDGSVCLDKNRANSKNGYKVCICGHSIIYGAVNQYPSIFDRLNIMYSSGMHKGRAWGLVTYTLNGKDFVNSGVKFSIKRKQDRIDALRKLIENPNEYHGTSDKDDCVL